MGVTLTGKDMAHAEAEVRAYLALVHKDTRSGYCEVARACRGKDGSLRFPGRRMGRGFVAAGDIESATRIALSGIYAGDEVFLGVLPRRARRARREAVGEGRIVWVDVDDPNVAPRLSAFGRPAHIVVSSGSGGWHLYWRLYEALLPQQLEGINLRLARHLGADERATDRLRLLRVPQSHNAKAGGRAELVALRPGFSPYRPEELLEGVAEIAPPPALHAPRRFTSRDVLRETAPEVWFQSLCGVEVPRAGFISCPLPDHDDPRPSCRVFSDPARGWWCFGCGRGGSVYDLASLLHGGPWGRGLFGDDFRRARRLAEERLGRSWASGANRIAPTRVLRECDRGKAMKEG